MHRLYKIHKIGPKFWQCPKSHGKFLVRPFLSFLEGSESKSELRLWLKSFPGPLENLQALAVHNCSSPEANFKFPQCRLLLLHYFVQIRLIHKFCPSDNLHSATMFSVALMAHKKLKHLVLTLGASQWTI